MVLHDINFFFKSSIYSKTSLLFPERAPTTPALTQPFVQNSVSDWFLIDAKGLRLGRLATLVSRLIRGQENMWTSIPEHIPYILVVNAKSVEVTGKKEKQKLYRRNSQRPGGLKEEVFEDLKRRLPNRIFEHAILGMLPKNKDRKRFFQRVLVYDGDIRQDPRYGILLDKFAITELQVSVNQTFQGGDRT